jgi:phosphoglucosamine mutase
MTVSLFGTDGIRGVAGAFPLDEATMVTLGRVIGSQAAGAGIAVGRDGRESGAAIEGYLARGLAGKAEIHSCGIIPTPGLAFMTRKLGARFGIMVSASHNPYRDNGVKIFNCRGEKISAALESRISAQLKAAAKTTGLKPVIKTVDPLPEYMDFLLAGGRGLLPGKTRIVLDCANGAASEIAPALFRALGMDVRTHHARPDGRNINAGCGSTYPQTLAKLVLEEKAGLGIALDGDADRVIFADREGQVLSGDHVLYVLALYLRRNEPRFNGRVVGTVMANLGLETALAAQGIELVRSRVGDSQVYRQMKKNNAILGGEPSGHIILKHVHSTGDGMLAALFFIRAMEFFAWSGADLRRRLKLYPQQVVNIPVCRKKNLARWETLADAQREFGAKHGRQARLLIRYSGTEPLVRVMMEAHDSAVIRDELPFFTALIQNEIGA